MGGHAAGEVASRLAVEVIESFINDTRDADVNRTWPFPYDTALSLDGNRLKAAFRLANRAPRVARWTRDDALRGMATTAAAVLIANGTPVVAHVGDSRVYRLARRQARAAHRRIIRGSASRCARACSPTPTPAGIPGATSSRARWRAATTRTLTSRKSRCSLATGCSSAPTVCRASCHSKCFESIVSAASSLDEACRALIAAANEAGGPDNITVAMLKVDVA